MKERLDSQCVAIRADASLSIGTGHISRTVELANQLQQLGARMTFICRNEQGNMQSEIERAGHLCELISSHPKESSSCENANQAPFCWRHDVRETSRIIKKNKAGLLVIDHHLIDCRWENVFKKKSGSKIMVIDGLANRKHQCDLVLDLTVEENYEIKWRHLLPPSCKIFGGVSYAFMRQEFKRYRQRKLISKKGVKNIFIFFGGVDSLNTTSLVLDAISNIQKQSFNLQVVIGNRNPHKDRIIRKCSQIKHIKLHIQPANIPQLMSTSDLAISSGGMILIEQCFMRLPSLTISVAANQIKPCKNIQNTGAGWYLGHHTADNEVSLKENIKINLLELTEHSSKLTLMQRRCHLLMAENATKNNKLIDWITGETQ